MLSKKANLIVAFVFYYAIFFSPVVFSKEAPHIPSDAMPIPMIMQSTNYSCGAAALMSVLIYWQVFSGVESDLYPVLKTTPQHGTDPRNMVVGANKFGLKAFYRENLSISDLKYALSRGETIILDIQAWGDDDSKAWKDRWEDGHYVVLVALDSHYAYLMDPVVPMTYVYVPISELLERWHDYENPDGQRWEFQHLAIFIRGKSPIKKLPLPLARLQ